MEWNQWNGMESMEWNQWNGMESMESVESTLPRKRQ